MRLLWRIFFSFLACSFAALLITTWHANNSLRDFYRGEVASDLETKAGILAREIRPRIMESAWADVDRHCKEFGRLAQTRVTVVLRDGTVVGDSEDDPSRMENHSDRPEVAAALNGGRGESVRFSDTMGRTLMYLAIPFERDGEVVGVARASVPLSVIDWTLRNSYRHIAIGALLAAVLFSVAAFFLAQWISRPLDEMRNTAARLAAGDLGARAAVSTPPEMAALARTLNVMADQLAERIAVNVRQSEQQKAVFSSMVEGVLAVDGKERVLDMNISAGRMLNVAPDQARGRSIQEAVRDPDLQKFVAAALAAGNSAETEISLHGNEERFLQVHGSVLRGAAGENMGALIVLNDISRIKRLERVRQDFVANVSHELKTPMTALKGCLETLAGMDEDRSPDTQRFMEMMARQVERLAAIVEDLLSLSRIEHEAEHKRVPLEPGPVRDVLRGAAQACLKSAGAKGITIETVCPDSMIARINAPLLEQAVVNLIDNAVKYSPEGTRVEVRGTSDGDSVSISVRDEGPGIERKHLPRIFERFYRVDQARSRALGGTGLGLAIVKHIAIAHHGSVAVDSCSGEGSTFTIRLPMA